MTTAENTIHINEEELHRAMQDCAFRVESVGFGQKKYAAVQKLMSKILVLPDKDFDAAFVALEAMVDGILAQKIKPDTAKAKTTKISAFDILPVRPIQNLKT